MADRFEGFDLERDREYLRRMLGDEDFKLLFRDLDRSLPEDIGEGRPENEDGREFEYILGVSDDSPESPPVDSGADPGNGLPVPGVTGGPAVGHDFVAPAVDVGPEPHQDAGPDRAPTAQGLAPAPAEPGKGDGQQSHPLLPELDQSDARTREKMRWWGFREKALRRMPLAGTDDRDQLLARGLVTYIERVLINMFHEAVPPDSGPWTSHREQREIQVRERRLRDTEPQRLLPFKGWPGIIAWLQGKKPVSLEIYYLQEIAKMEREPDDDVPFQELAEALEVWEEHNRLIGGQDVSDDHPL